jgi:ABC-2 type transport system permease protein
MRATISLIRREFTAYFLSPVAYVALAVFLLVTGILFSVALDQLTASGPVGVSYPMLVLLGDDRFWLLFLFIPPLLTMRLLAEERGSGTLEMLMTAPIKEWQVVYAKFKACMMFYTLMWLPTLLYLPFLLNMKFAANWQIWTPYSITMVAGVGLMALGGLLVFFGRIVWGGFFAFFGLIAAGVGGYLHDTKDNPHLIDIICRIDPYPVLTSYIGVLLAGSMFLSIGLYVSSLVKSQMVAAMISLVTGLIFIVGGFVQQDVDFASDLGRFIFYFSVPQHFRYDFARGVLDTRHIVLYVTVTFLMLFMTVRSLEARRLK